MMRLKTMLNSGLAILLPLSLGACLIQEPRQFSQPGSKGTEVVSRSFTVDLKADPETGGFRLLSGQDYGDFLQDIEKIAPGKIELTADPAVVNLEGLLADLGALKSGRSRKFSQTPADIRKPLASDVRVEVTYFLYRVPHCGSGYAYRKLDDDRLMTPGFGCAVDQNLILSTVDPSEWSAGQGNLKVIPDAKTANRPKQGGWP